MQNWRYVVSSAISVSDRIGKRLRSTLLVGVLGLGLAGCAQTETVVSPNLRIDRTGKTTVLLMPTDILVQELSVGGVPETNAAWTAQGKRGIEQALARVLQEKNARMVPFGAGDAEEDAHIQLLKLHEAVGSTIMVHKYLPTHALPTKKDKFDWTLGPDAVLLHEAYEADYALFVYFRDSFASAGRVAAIIVAAALGVGIPGGQQVGFASLVDLSNGDVIWFNVLQSGYGDIRTPDGAFDAAESLLEDLPL